MSPTPRAEFGVVFTAEGDDVTRAVRALTGELRQMGAVTKRTSRQSTSLGRSFRNIALRTIGIIATVRAFDALADGIRGAVGAGLAFNEAMETAELAIASLITAQARLVTQNGRQLEGTEALEAATGLAADQIRKLRIAGIQTAATTDALVDAFQQAVGAGTAAGLTLDEVRTFTIRLAQAAGTMGLPYRQLNEEIRSILSGTIDQNTRIAKQLGLTNQQIQQAKEQGRLAEFLLEKFEAFGIAGERLTETFAGLKSNIQDSFSIFAGDSVRPLFERLSKVGNEALAEIFDLKTAEISPDFQPLVDTAQRLFAEIGDILAGAINRGVDAAQDLGRWLEENRDTVDQMTDEFGDVLEAIGHVSRETAGVLVTLTRWNAELGIVSQGFKSVGDIIEFIGDNAALTLLTLAGISTGIGAAFFAFFGLIPSIVLGSAAALVTLTGTIDWLITTEAELEAETRRSNKQQTEAALAAADRASSAARLASELKKLEQAQAEGGQSAEEQADAQKRVEEIEQQLIRLAPEYRAAIDGAKFAHGSVADAVRDEAQAQLELLFVRQHAASRRVQDLRDQLAEFRLQQEILKPTRRRAQLIKELEASLSDAEATSKRLNAAFQELRASFAAGGPPEIIPGAGDDEDDDGKGALRLLKAQIQLAESEIKRALQRQQGALDDALRDNRIAYEQYYDDLLAAQLEAIDGRIALQNRLLDATTAADARLQIEAKLVDLQAEREKTEADTLKKRTEALEKYTEAVEKIEIRLLQVQGATTEARRRALEAEFRDMLAQMIAEADTAGVEMIERLIDLEVAKSRFEELEKVITRGQTRLRDRIEEIELLEQTGALSARDARLQQAAAYEEVRGIIAATLPELREMARLTGDPEALAQVQRLEVEMLRLGETIKDLSNEWRKFGRDAKQALIDGLADSLATAGQQAQSFADFMREMAASVVASIQRMIAEMIAFRIVQASTGLFSAGGSVGDTSGLGRGELGVSAASGGLIRGPGGPTDDRIPAWLSAGEYVIRARAVDRYGVDFFEEINRGARGFRVPPMRSLVPQFAQGGLVERPARNGAGGGEDTLRGEIGLDDGLVFRLLESPRGRRFMLDFVSKNRRAITSTLSS